MHDAMNHIDSLMNRTGELTGLPTGFRELDKNTGGFQPGDLVILAARPSMGKTALALNIARNTAVDHGKRVAVFSLEMTTRALVLRMLSAEARVDSSAFRSGFIPTKSYEELAAESDRNESSGAGSRNSASSGSGSGEEEEEIAGGPFQQVEDVQEQVKTLTTALFNEARTLMTVRSSTFSIWVEVRLGRDGPRRVRRYVVRRDGMKLRLILSEAVTYNWFREPTEEEEEGLERR